MSRKTIHAVALGALVGASVPALAAHDGWNDQGDLRGHRQEQVVIAPQRSPTRVMVDRPLHMNRPVYAARPLYAEAPYYYRPVYGPAPIMYPTVPAYRVHREPNVLGAGLGAAVGAVLGSQVGSRHSRAATAAVGAAIGGIIGSQF